MMVGAMADDEELDPEPQPDEALGLQHYRADCQRDPGQFAQLHGRAFLILQRAGERRLNRPKRFQSTLALQDPPAAARELDPSRYLVFPVRKSPRSTIDRFYSVGQTRNNDIVIRDATVSKSHAFFENAPDGDGLVLKDSRSRNGTFVNGAKIGAEGVRVQAGDRVRFGHVELKLLDVVQLCELVRRIRSSG
jgi:hypothetical protein